MKTKRDYSKIALGKVDNRSIFLSPPSWDCNWYWGFGYLGNKDCHYHVDGLQKIETYHHGVGFTVENVNLYEGFKRHFGESFIVKDDKDIWRLAELFKTFYTLRQVAEVYYRGGSHITSNPCESVIKNKEEYSRINEIVLPSIFEEIYLILEKYI